MHFSTCDSAAAGSAGPVPTPVDRPTSYTSIVCSNNVSILHHFLDTTTFTEYVTARNLESIFEKKQLRLKTTDSFRFMYAHNVQLRVIFFDEWELERFQTAKVTLILVPFDATHVISY